VQVDSPEHPNEDQASETQSGEDDEEDDEDDDEDESDDEDEEEEDDEDEESDSSESASESSGNLAQQDSASPTPRVLLPSPMQDRTSRVTAAATMYSVPHAHMAGTATTSTLASAPPGAATATLDTSGDIMSHSKLLTSKDSSAGNSSQIFPCLPQPESSAGAPLHSQPSQPAQLNTQSPASSDPPSDRRRIPPTWDYLQQTAVSYGSGAGSHTPALSQLHSSGSFTSTPPLVGSGGVRPAHTSAGDKKLSFMHAAEMPSPDRDRPFSGLQGRPAARGGQPLSSRHSYHEVSSSRRPVHADFSYARCAHTRSLPPCSSRFKIFQCCVCTACRCLVRRVGALVAFLQ
jgi:hypothetical protein